LHSSQTPAPSTATAPSPLLLLLLAQARYNLVALKDEAFPRYKLFKKGADTKKPLEYTGNMKQAKELLRWTVEQTGVFIGIKVEGGMMRCWLQWQRWGAVLWGGGHHHHVTH
jgi:hypothetical protein